MPWQQIECHATFTLDGRPQPRAIIWDGKRLAVLDTGRRWPAADGLHLLARVADGRVFELRYNAVAWWARIASEPPRVL